MRRISTVAHETHVDEADLSWAIRRGVILTLRERGTRLVPMAEMSQVRKALAILQ